MEKLEFLRLMSLFSVALCVGIGAIGPAIGIGYIGSKALEAIARKKAVKSLVFNFMLLSMAITGTGGMYALFISVLLYHS